MAEAGKVAIVLKVGTSEMGARAALAHTGALVGSDRSFSAMLRYYNAIRVDDFGNWLEHLEVFSRATPPRGRRIGAVTNSGGEGEYFADKAEQAGIPLQQFSPELKARIKAEFPNFSDVGNPVDCWAIDDDRVVFPRVFELMAESGEFDVLVSDIDHSNWLVAGERQLAQNIADDLRAACDGHRSVPVRDHRHHRRPADRGHRVGAAARHPAAQGLAARAAGAGRTARAPAAGAGVAPAAGRSPLPGAGALAELDSAEIAAAYGVPTSGRSAARPRTRPWPPPSGSATRSSSRSTTSPTRRSVGGVALDLVDARRSAGGGQADGWPVIVAEQVRVASR